jgi:hypothetical protein
MFFHVTCIYISFFRLHLELVENYLTFLLFCIPEKFPRELENCLDIAYQGEVGVCVGDGEVNTIAYKTETDVPFSFCIEGWKNLIQTKQDLQVGQAMLITARKTTRKNCQIAEPIR